MQVIIFSRRVELFGPDLPSVRLAGNKSVLFLWWSAAFSVQSSSESLHTEPTRTERGFCPPSGVSHRLFTASLHVVTVYEPRGRRCHKLPLLPRSLKTEQKGIQPHDGNNALATLIIKVVPSSCCHKVKEAWQLNRGPSWFFGSSCICIFNFQFPGCFIRQFCPFKLSVRICLPFCLAVSNLNLC